MSDISIAQDGDISEAQGETEAGIDFVDGYFPDGKYQVIDSGCIKIETKEVEEFTKEARRNGLIVNIGHEK